jgi:glutamyl-tRNA synthetase
MIRTRFAPSPTGYLHLGGARTALFSWAFARKNGGKFILRVEDTDQERSTLESEKAILDGLTWLGIDWDEGPFFQMQRLDRYHEVAQQLLAEGKAYHCYASKDELDSMREAQRARGEKPRYDGRWRPEPGKTLPAPPTGVKPIVRFRTPQDGEISFNDLIKGRVTIANSELDDLVIMRADGIPTYNFGVVIDDWDMGITHVIRGDDHVNNTPRQINILQALGAPLPVYAHVPMILGNDGERLSKRHGAVSVLQYQEDGYLPEAMLNYLARLGWGYGDAEKFSIKEFIRWFEVSDVSHSASRFSQEKLSWLNQQYLKEADNTRLAQLLEPILLSQGIDAGAGPDLAMLAGLHKERVATLMELADAAHIFYRHALPEVDALREQLAPGSVAAFADLHAKFSSVDWQGPLLNSLLKDTAQAHNLKMGQIGIPLRLALFGTTQTPSLDATLVTLGREETLRRFDTVWPLIEAAAT